MSISEKIREEIQKLSPSQRIYLYELDLTPFGDEKYYFHAGTNGISQPVTWQGVIYTPWAIEAKGFDKTKSGSFPRPNLRVSNVAGSITALIMEYDDILGAKFTRRCTLAKFLDAVNFPSGVNALADPSAHFADEIYYINRRSEINSQYAVFELASVCDVHGAQLPARKVVQNACPFRYRGAYCGYTGTNYFKYDDSPTLIAAEDNCGKRLSSCKCRFGENEELPYGAFPAAGV